MKQIKIIALREFLATQANHWAFFPIIILFSDAPKPSAFNLLCWFFLGFMPFLLFFAREFVQSLLLQIVLFPICAGILYLMPIDPPFLKASYLFFSAAYLMASLLKMIKRDDHATRIFPFFVPLGINLVLGIIVAFVHSFHFSFFMHFAAILSITCSLMANYVSSYLIYVRRNEETASNMPKAKIFHSGAKSAFMYVALLIVPLIFIASFSVSDDFFQIIRYWFRSMMKAIFSKINATPDERNTHLQDGPATDPTQMPTLPNGQPSFFWRVLEVIVFAIVILLIVYALGTIILKIIHALSSLHRTKILIEAEEETEDLDLHEELKEHNSYKEQEENESLLSPRQRIRRMYRRKALSTQKEIYELNRMTAREVAMEEKNPEIATVYEKARYSELPCTKEDVTQMQAACRRKQTSEA